MKVKIDINELAQQLEDKDYNNLIVELFENANDDSYVNLMKQLWECDYFVNADKKEFLDWVKTKNKIQDKNQTAIPISDLRDIIENALIDIPIAIERIKDSDLKESIKEEQITFRKGLECAYKIVQKYL